MCNLSYLAYYFTTAVAYSVLRVIHKLLQKKDY